MSIYFLGYFKILLLFKVTIFENKCILGYYIRYWIVFYLVCCYLLCFNCEP